VVQDGTIQVTRAFNGSFFTKPRPHGNEDTAMAYNAYIQCIHTIKYNLRSSSTPHQQTPAISSCLHAREPETQSDHDDDDPRCFQNTSTFPHKTRSSRRQGAIRRLAAHEDPWSPCGTTVLCETREGEGNACKVSDNAFSTDLLSLPTVGL